MTNPTPAASGAAPASLSKTDIARIWRRVTGGVQFQPHEYVLFRAIADEAAALASREASPATLTWTDQEIEAGARSRGCKWHTDGYWVFEDADLHPFVRSLLALASPQVAPAGYLVDPGAGSAMDKFQCWAPSADQLADIKRRGGSVSPLYATPVAPQDDARDAADTRRMNWLETMAVNVRVPLRCGSRDLFWSIADDEDGFVRPGDIRSKIDAAMRRSAPAAKPTEEPQA